MKRKKRKQLTAPKANGQPGEVYLIREDGMPVGGRKSKFSEEMIIQVEQLTKLGANLAQIGEFFGISEATIHNWDQVHPEWREARKRGEMVANMKVADSLYKIALGYKYQETEVITDMDGDIKHTKIVEKQVAPNLGAIIHWLKNHAREFWSDAQHHHHTHEGSLEHVHKALEEVDTSDLSKEETKLLFKITNKQLTDGTRSN